MGHQQSKEDGKSECQITDSRKMSKNFQFLKNDENESGVNSGFTG